MTWADFPTPWTIGLRVHSTGAANSWGDPVPSWAEPVDRAVYGWAPASTAEGHDAGRSAVELDLDVFGPTETLGDIQPRDRLVIDGNLYEVEGRVENFDRGPFGFAPGVRVGVKRVEG